MEYLEFELPIKELEDQLQKCKLIGEESNVDVTETCESGKLAFGTHGQDHHGFDILRFEYTSLSLQHPGRIGNILQMDGFSLAEPVSTQGQYLTRQLREVCRVPAHPGSTPFVDGFHTAPIFAGETNTGPACCAETAYARQ